MKNDDKNLPVAHSQAFGLANLTPPSTPPMKGNGFIARMFHKQRLADMVQIGVMERQISEDYLAKVTASIEAISKIVSAQDKILADRATERNRKRVSDAEALTAESKSNLAQIEELRERLGLKREQDDYENSHR